MNFIDFAFLAHVKCIYYMSPTFDFNPLPSGSNVMCGFVDLPSSSGLHSLNGTSGTCNIYFTIHDHAANILNPLLNYVVLVKSGHWVGFAKFQWDAQPQWYVTDLDRFLQVVFVTAVLHDILPDFPDI